jgi:hypothetical protein
MKAHLFLFFIFLLAHSLCFAQENGFSYWWQSDGIIDYQQMEELDALSGDAELWCALAELYVGREQAEAAECAFEEPKKKGKKIWKLNLSGGANLDSSGNLKNRFAKANGKVWDISGEVRVKENDDVKGNAGIRHGIFYAKGGDLTSKYRGVLSELNLSDLRFGGQWLFRAERDSSWVYGKFSKNFLEKRVYTGGNFRMVTPYFGGNKLWSRTWQGVRFWDWNLRATEIAIVKEDENTLDFIWLAERKRRSARLAFEHDKNKSRISAGFTPVARGSDSLWSRAEHPLRLRLGWDKKMQNAKISHSLLVKENWKQGKPLDFRSESKIKFPLAYSPLLTIRWTAYIYKNKRIDLKQFYVESGLSF